MSKKFQHLVQQLQRNQGIRDANKRILVCFEDSKSAPRYFEALRKHRRLSSESVIIDVDDTVSDPLSVVNRAIELRRRLLSRDEFSNDDDDQAWVVIDVDRHETMPEAMSKAKQEKIRVAVSNPCFEYWILLHYEDTAPGVSTCDELIKNHVRAHIHDYDKGRTEFAPLAPKASDACARAERQFKGKAEGDPLKCCPCTWVYRLVESMHPAPGI